MSTTATATAAAANRAVDRLERAKTTGDDPRIDDTPARVAVRGPLIPSVDLAGSAGPVRLAEVALQDLAARIARDRVRERDRARPLEAGQPLARPVDQVVLPELGARAADHDRAHRLAPALVGHAD